MKPLLYKLRIGRWRFYIANCRLKKMNPSQLRKSRFYGEAMAAIKKRRYKQNGGTCDLCHCKVMMDDVELHHVLPYAEFPQYGMNPANLEMVCADCHHTIHMNPYINLRRMELKAQELGFSLSEYFCSKKNI